MSLFFLTFLTFLTSLTASKAQLNNLPFEERYRADTAPLPARWQERVRLRAHGMSFFRNLEYFNPIADGKTLFGQQVSVRGQYRIDSLLSVSAGIYLWQDFGSAPLRQVRPVFSLRYQRRRGTLIFGTLEGNLAHRQIEPLLDFERVITHRLEQGVQYQLSTRRLWLDTWVDWQRMIYPYDKAQERISGGVSAYYDLLQAGPYTLRGYLQGKGYHQGGQLDTSAAKPPLASFFSYAPGLRLSRALGRWSLWADGYYIASRGITSNSEYPAAIRDGHAWYANAQLAAPGGPALMASYYSGYGLYVPGGGQLYQSLSSQVNNAPTRYTERRRQLLILRLLYDVPLARQAVLSLRAEPYLDLPRRLLEYNYQLYINVML